MPYISTCGSDEVVESVRRSFAGSDPAKARLMQKRQATEHLAFAHSVQQMLGIAPHRPAHAHHTMASVGVAQNPAHKANRAAHAFIGHQSAWFEQVHRCGDRRVDVEAGVVEKSGPTLDGEGRHVHFDHRLQIVADPLGVLGGGVIWSEGDLMNPQAGARS